VSGRVRRLLPALLAATGLATALGAGPAGAAVPHVTAPQAILVEPATRDVVYARDADRRRPIASTTKMMTALVTVESMSLDDVISAVPYSAGPTESLLGTRAGQRMTVRDALRALMLVSANDVAATLAVRVAGSRAAFVRRMNARARQLGLRDTHFANPVGLDSPGNYSTASDLAKLALVVRENRFLRETTNLAHATIRVGGQTRRIANRNTLVGDWQPANGVKTGHTRSAGYILVGSATRKGVSVVSAVLGDPSEAARDRDSRALLTYGLSRYRVTTGVRKGERLARVKLSYRDEHVDLVASRTIRRTTRVGEHLSTRVVGVPDEIDGPLPEGARQGTVEVRQRGRVVDRVALVTARPVSAATAAQRLGDFLGRAGTILALALLVACSLILLLLRRRATGRRRPAGEAEAA
jgi:D-alanyl-D-alanine carboxypeptidase (penicillin-binding protein 5/6)